MKNTESNQIHPHEPIQKASENNIPSVQNTTEKNLIHLWKHNNTWYKHNE